MPKYIDFDALGVQSCNPDVFVNKGYAEVWNSLMRMLYDAPAADVEPVRHGRWEYDSDGLPCCSECGECAMQRLHLYFKMKSFDAPFVLTNFCPNCGAKMDAEPPKEEDNGEVH